MHENDTYCTGTLRQNRKDNPKIVVDENVKKGETVQAFTNKYFCVIKWRDKCNLLIVSSEHDGTLVKNKLSEFKPKQYLNITSIWGVSIKKTKSCRTIHVTE